MKISEVIKYIEQIAPPVYQESYDNAGLITGDSETEITNVLITLDSTEEVIEEAVRKNANLIISHHPIIFKGLKKITGKNYVERTIIKAIKNDIAIYAAHTNLDNVTGGVNAKIAEKLGLLNTSILRFSEDKYRKIITFVPEKNAEIVRNAIFEAGAGHIGNYDCCSYNTEGSGSFRAGENTNPVVGEKNSLHFEKEIRIETIYPKTIENKVISALIQAHPYEEPAYDIYEILNINKNIGAGIIGEIENEVSPEAFLLNLKQIFGVPVIRHTEFFEKKIKKIAICGGAGSFLLNDAIQQKADVFISGDFKYHEFFDAEKKIIIADIGHFESEQYTKQLFFDIVSKKFNTFACFLSEINTNPIKYI